MTGWTDPEDDPKTFFILYQFFTKTETGNHKIVIIGFIIMIPFFFLFIIFFKFQDEVGPTSKVSVY